MRWYAFFLYPFAFLYDLVTSLRNLLFDFGILKTEKSTIPSISVGNLSVGGTGKTPMIEFLIRHLSNENKIAILSRGYGRKTKGFLKANSTHGPREIGDEPEQIFRKFHTNVAVFVGEDRVAAAKKIAFETTGTGLILLDDAFQHRYFQADLSILLTTFQKPFSKDHLLPMGRLREARRGAGRADLVIVTKSKEGDLEEKKRVASQIQKYAGIGKPVLFSWIKYGEPFPLNSSFQFYPKVILFSGLADDTSLAAYVSSNFGLVERFSFPDHHRYTLEDFEKLKECFLKFGPKEVVLMTTEKDAGKVKSSCPAGFLAEIPIFVLPIEVEMSQHDLDILKSEIQIKVLNKGRTK